jgi:cell wall-associated protease
MILKNSKRVYLVIALFIIFTNVDAQKKAPDNWYNLDYKKDKVYGVSTEKTYTDLLKNKKSKTVIVAVIDGGTEVTHEDLKSIIWTNTNDANSNGKDDDQNGYIDDQNGWNYIGGLDSNVKEDNLEVTRVYATYYQKFNGIIASEVTNNDKESFDLFKKAEALYLKKYDEATKMTLIYSQIEESLVKIKDFVKTDKPTENALKAFPINSMFDKLALENMTMAIKREQKISDMALILQGAKEHFKVQLDFQLNKEFNSRKYIGDDYNNLSETNYGNNRVSGPGGSHGTHVAGIIAAVRNNNLGIKGVSDNTKIMVLRVVPDGDERDKDIAHSIRYAADNGAKIINMSFGKALSPNKKVVDDAVKYAISKDVLLIHAAGNDNSNTDTIENYPTPRYFNSSEKATSWIEVGASTWKKKKNLTAPFSNFGKTTVDVFAPGFDIFSTVSENKYDSYSGTSMAAPVVAGVAAVLRSYFPEITADQTKALILESSIKYKKKVFIPGTHTKTKLSEISTTGGIVNLYNAVQLGLAKGYKMME